VNLSARFLGPLVDQTQHSLEDKALGFFANMSPFKVGLTTALGDRFRVQYNGPDNLIIVLNGVDEFEPELREFLC